MEPNVPAHLQLTIKAFKVSRAPILLLQDHRKRLPVLGLVGVLSGGVILWSLGSIHERLRNPSSKCAPSPARAPC